MNPPAKGRRAFTLVELLVTIAVIGVLVGLLLPAVQAAREAARRTQCQNRLKQIGLALHEYHNANEAFPTGCVEWRPWGNTTKRQLAWSAFLLPQLEQQTLFDQLDLSKPFDDPANQAAETTLVSYLCPSNANYESNQASVPKTFGRSDFGGIYGERITGPNNPAKGVMLLDRAIRISEITDGTSQTLIVAEDSRSPDGQWINGRNLFDQAFAINAAPSFENDIRSEHPGGANGLDADGSVHFLAESTEELVLAAWCTRSGEELIEGWSP